MFGPDQIITGLTDERYVTSQYKHPLSASQRERTLMYWAVLADCLRVPIKSPGSIASANWAPKTASNNGWQRPTGGFCAH